jgi:hypothetical protein
MHYDNLEYDPIAFLTITLYMVLFVISVLDYFTDSVSLVFFSRRKFVKCMSLSFATMKLRYPLDIYCLRVDVQV